MADLISPDAARRHLRLPEGFDVTLLAPLVEQASAAIVAFLARDDDDWTAEMQDWTPDTTPPVVQAATAMQVAHLWMHRGDEGGDGISKEAETLLRGTGYRDLVMA